MTWSAGRRRSALIVCLFLAASSASAQNRAHWMREAKWGVMTHYLADWRARTDNLTMNVETWNQLVDNFDVEGLADQLKAVGAGYQILTIGQNSGYFAAPNPTYDRITGIQPSKCSRRDLISDMATALSKRGIKLIVYLPAGAPAGDRAAREALQWQEGAYRNVEFQLKWEQVIRDWSVRFGTKVVGWWYDGCFWPNTMYRTPDAPNFSTFAAAARAGNPESALAFNMGSIPRVISSSPFDDYTGGEETNPARMEIRRASGGMLDGVQLHVLSYLGKAWGTGDPRFSNEDAIKYSMEVRKLDGAITWDIPVQKNGLIPKPIMDQLAVINKAVREQPAAAPAPAPKPRAAWMQGARWGVMSHFLADWVTRTNKITLNVENWNKLVDGFDVEGVAKQLDAVGAGYYLISIGQNSEYYLSPNATLDRFVGIQPSQCSRRDLVADLYQALSKRGIKLMVYLAPGLGNRVAATKMGLRPGGGRNVEFQLNREKVIREWSERWGTNVVGWWFDGCYQPNVIYRHPDPPNFGSLAAAARAGNPGSVVAFNPGVTQRLLSLTPDEDYTGGEANDLDRVQIRRAENGFFDGAQIHILSYLGKTWGVGDPRFNSDQVVKWSQDIRKQRGVITWDVPPQASGLISEPFMEQLRAVGKALAEPAAQ